MGLVGLAFADDGGALADRVGEGAGLDVGDLGAEVMVERQLRAGLDLDPAENHGAVGGALDAARLGEGVADDGRGDRRRQRQGAGQGRAEREDGDEGERY